MKPLPVFRRDGMTLVPANPASAAEVLRVKDGERAVFKRRQPRNLKHHRLMFGIFNKLIEATGKWHSPEALLNDIMDALGRGEEVVNQLTGEVRWVREHINFEAMDQQRFAELYEQVIALLTDRLGFNPEILLDDQQPIARAA